MLQLVRPLAAQQLVEHDAERIHVAGRAERLAEQLLGARVRDRQRPPGHAGQLGLDQRVAALGFHQLRDAEIEQPHLALRGDEDVRRLQVAVDHEVRVRMLDREQHLSEQPDPRLDTQRARVAPRGQRLAFDVFKREPGLACGRDARIVQPGNVRVVQRRKDVALARKALRESIALRRSGAAAELARVPEQQLDRDLALERPVVALRQPDLGHAAGAEPALQPVRADAVAFVPLVRQRLRPQRQRRRRVEEAVVADLLARREHLFELRQQRVRLRAQLR